jgi:hypothetical protein
MERIDYYILHLLDVRKVIYFGEPNFIDCGLSGGSKTPVASRKDDDDLFTGWKISGLNN